MFTRDADLARAAFEAWEDGRSGSRRGARVHPDLEFHDAPEMPDAQVDPRSRGVRLRGWTRTWSSSAASRYPCARWRSARDGVFVRVAPVRPRAPSGVTIDWEVFCVMRFRDGRLVEIRNYFDRETALEEADLDRLERPHH